VVWVDLRDGQRTNAGVGDDRPKRRKRRVERDAARPIRVLRQRCVGEVDDVDVEVHHNRGVHVEKGEGTFCGGYGIGAHDVDRHTGEAKLVEDSPLPSRRRTEIVGEEQHALGCRQRLGSGEFAELSHRVGKGERVRDAGPVESTVENARRRVQVRVEIEVQPARTRLERLGRACECAESGRTVAPDDQRAPVARDRLRYAVANELGCLDDTIGVLGTWVGAVGSPTLDREVARVGDRDACSFEEGDDLGGAKSRRGVLLTAAECTRAGGSTDQFDVYLARPN
jgi:hypothetical protein